MLRFIVWVVTQEAEDEGKEEMSWGGKSDTFCLRNL